MPDGFKRPGQGSRTGKALPFSLRGGTKKGGSKNHATRKDTAVASPSCGNSSAAGAKRPREEDDVEKPGDIKKARAETFTSPTDLSAFFRPTDKPAPAPVSNDPELADFFDGAHEEEDLEFEDVDIEPLYDSPGLNEHYPGLCTKKAAEANEARYLAQQAKERDLRAQELETIAEVAANIPDLSVPAAYNTYKNCPLRIDETEKKNRATKGENHFHDGNLSLEGDKQYLHWTRSGSEYAVVSLKATDLTYISFAGDHEIAGLEVRKDFPADFEGPAHTKDFNFIFSGEEAIKTTELFASALKKLHRATKPVPTTVPTKLEHGMPTPADSAYGDSPPPTASEGHTSEKIAANDASTRSFRTALNRYGTTGTWEGKTFNKNAMVKFLLSKDTFHNIIDSTAWGRGMQSKSKATVQAQVVSYLQTYPLEGAIEAPAQVASGPKFTPISERGREEQMAERVVVRPGLFKAEWNGVDFGLYRTDEEAKLVVQQAMLREAQEARESGEERVLKG